MKYCLAIYGSPGSSRSGQTALHFAKTALSKGHEILRIFFYQDAVHIASALSTPPQGESHLSQEWQAFVTDNKLDTVVCIAAALRRGIVNDQEAQRYELSAKNLTPGYELSGLGQLLEGTVEADRVVTFGG